MAVGDMVTGVLTATASSGTVNTDYQPTSGTEAVLLVTRLYVSLTASSLGNGSGDVNLYVRHSNTNYPLIPTLTVTAAISSTRTTHSQIDMLQPTGYSITFGAGVDAYQQDIVTRLPITTTNRLRLSVGNLNFSASSIRAKLLYIGYQTK